MARPILLAALTQDALSDTGPLYKTISSYITEDILAAIAAEYTRGAPLIRPPISTRGGR